MGTIVDEPAKAVKIDVVVEDADAEDAIAKIALFEDGKVVETKEPGQSKCEWKTSCSPDPGPHYYFVTVTQADGNRLWSAPVWLKIGDR